MTSFLRGVLAAAALASLPAHAAGTARLLTMDAAETIDAPVLGLQRTAVPLPGGFAVDTALLADLGLLPNLGLRWAAAFGPHRVVVGARYALFVGTPAYSAVLHALEPAVQRYDPSYSGPSAYALYGLTLGPLTVAAEARGRMMYFLSGSLTVGVTYAFSESWMAVLEGGLRFLQGAPPFQPTLAIQPKAAAGIRLAGKGFGFTAGAAYVGFNDPMLPALPIIPAIDLCWSFS